MSAPCPYVIGPQRRERTLDRAVPASCPTARDRVVANHAWAQWVLRSGAAPRPPLAVRLEHVDIQPSRSVNVACQRRCPQVLSAVAGFVDRPSTSHLGVDPATILERHIGLPIHVFMKQPHSFLKARRLDGPNDFPLSLTQWVRLF